MMRIMSAVERAARAAARMSNRPAALILVAAMVAAGAQDSRAADPRNVRYVDAHSHLFKAMSGDDEIAAFRKAGVAGVLIMWPDPVPVLALAKKNPGYAVPWISLSALQASVLTDDTADLFVRARDESGFCGFGEMATRLPPPNAQVSDAAFVSDPRRIKIYDAADAKGTPVNMHVSLVEPETMAAVERIVSTHPHTPFIVAHGGGGIEAEAIGRLLAAHPNLYFDLSGPLSPQRPDTPPRPQSALAADGALKPGWRAVIERFPDRFLFAMDIQSVESVQGIPGKLAAARKAFAPLPPATEEAFAHGNIERLLKGCGGLAPRSP
jgi:predicted TIM-barrel fold metal-dependent hydrolase